MVKNILLILRFLIAGIFIVSGFEKAFGPSENFLYVLQAYDFLPDSLEKLASVVFPWVELGIGVFLALGLWTRLAFVGLACMSGSLILVVGQAIMRHLPIDDCGCFGSLIHLPIQGVIFLDITMFISAVFSLKNISAVRRFSLDHYFDKNV